MELGINLSFAVKRWPEPEAWAAFVRRNLGLAHVQFTFDLLDPWWPAAFKKPLAARVRKALDAEGLTLHSAFVGLAAYTYNALLHSEAEGRQAGAAWFERAADLAAELGAPAVGGPLGGSSVTHTLTDRGYDALLETLGHLTAHAKRAGLSAWLIEPTPLRRELPWHVGEAERLLRDLEGVAALPVRYALDLGHALYKPLYGEDAALGPWLALGDAIGLIHLQQTDGLSDSHWGFTRPGVVNLSEVRAQLEAANLEVPLFLEVFYPFEQDDEEVRDDMISSVAHCRAALGDA